MNKVLVIDGENLLHRSYHAAYKLWHEKKPDMYVRFFLSTLKSYVTQFQPDKIVCTWDYRKSGLSNERKELYEDYKKDRVFNEAVQKYADDIREILDSLGVA
jgi:5'-3' exonuclease